MDELDQRRGIDVLTSPIVHGMRREKHQKWSQALAAARDDVRRHLVDQSHFAMQALANTLIDCRQVIAHQLSDIFYFH